MKKPLQIVVQGKTAPFAFNFRGDPKHLPEWEAQGLQVDEVVNSVPVWVVRARLTRPWIAMQDAWSWARLF